MTYAFVIILSIAMALSIFSRRLSFLSLASLIFFYFFIDYANYQFNLGDSLLGTLAKSYKEMLLIAAAALALLNASLSSRVSRNYLLFSSICLVCLAYGVSLNSSYSALIDFRNSVVPVLLAFTLAECGVLNARNVRRLLTLTGVAVAINSAIAIIDYVTFNGDPESIWRYSFLLEQRLSSNSDYEERLIGYQVSRGGNLRSSGVFASALHFSYIAAFTAFYYFSSTQINLRSRRWSRAASSSILFALCFGGVIVSQVRASLIIFASSIIIYYICSNIRRGSPSARVTASHSLLALGILAYAIFIIFFSGNFDASARGRLPQYVFGLQNLSILGAGLGSYTGQFDSYYVYGSVTFGIIFLIWIIYALQMHRKAFSVRDFDVRGDLLHRVSFLALPPALLISAFQHFSGSLYYQIVWILLFSAPGIVSQGTARKLEDKLSQEDK